MHPYRKLLIKASLVEAVGIGDLVLSCTDGIVTLNPNGRGFKISVSNGIVTLLT